MWALIYVAVGLNFYTRQASAGDVFPIQTIEGLWPQEPYQDQMEFEHQMNMTLFDVVDDERDIAWFKTNIVDKYGFQKDQKLDMWKKQGSFGKALGTPEFREAASRVLAFFKRNADWSVTKSKEDFRNPQNGKCLELLYITAARYLLVTHVLWEESGEQLIPCQSDSNTKIVTITQSVCYPEPYGSATCTSDYDVGLVGKDSGILTEKFNNYFEGSNGFLKPSEKVFDTNVYAFTLEYAVTKMFIGLPNNFAETVAAAEEKVDYKMQELVHAYYKVFKYNAGFSSQLLETAKATLGPKMVKLFNKWDKKVQEYHNTVPLTGDDVRQAHNTEYQALVKSISDAGGYTQPEQKLETLGKALLYAAEAYHTRGAIRHVVAALQLNLADYQPNKLSMMDLWVSMIENWGESLKEYNHACNGVNMEVCVLKMSKYMWRMVAAMKNLKQRIETLKKQEPKGASIKPLTPEPTLVRLEGGDSPEEMMRVWYEKYKKAGEAKIPSTQLDVSSFFRGFGCKAVLVNKPLPFQCLEIMNGKIDVYNKKLAEIFTKQHSTATRGQRSIVSGEKLSKPSLKDVLLRRPN